MRFLAMLSIIVFSTAAYGKTLYVNNLVGSNSNLGMTSENGGARSGPVRTIGAALNRAAAGDRIEIANTGIPYAECLTLQGTRHSGSRFRPFLINGNGATLDGSAETANDRWDARDSRHRVGITLYNVKYAVIHNLHIRGFQLDGVNAHDNAMECILSSTICSENGRSGITVAGASRVRVVDGALFNNGGTQLNAEGWSTTRLTDTQLVSVVAPVWTRAANAHGHGARVVLEGVLQTALQGQTTTEAEAQAWFKQREQALQASALEAPVDDDPPTAMSELAEVRPEGAATLAEQSDVPTATDVAESAPDPFEDDAASDELQVDSEASDPTESDVFSDESDPAAEDDPFADF